MVEVLGNHIEGFVGCVSDEEEVGAIAEGEDGRLHVGWAEDYLVQG
jgi:hypothetical protein